MAPSVNYLGKDSYLKILCATKGNDLVGIAPFRITPRSLKGHLGYGIIEPLANGETDYNGLIITEQGDQILQLFLKYLFMQKDWDFLYFPDLPQTSQTFALIKNAKGIPKFEVEAGFICPYIAIPDSKEKLQANLNGKSQKKLRNRLHKMEREQGKVELKHHYEIGSLEETIEIFIKLHQKRWILKGEPGRFANQKSRNITIQTANYFAEKDWLRLYFLTVNNEPVAAELDLEYEGKMYCHLKCFDPDFYKYSVGNLLTSKVLEECVEKGISEYDFMQGDEAYKFDWTNKFRRNMNVKWVNKKMSSNMISVGLKVLKRTKIDSILFKYIRILYSLREVLIHLRNRLA
jgi:CelD/BcsL family acetyltransferase involved in cellulose biosynthesis